MGLILIAATGYAIGPMIFNRRLADLDARATMAAPLAIAAVILDARPGCSTRPRALRPPGRSPRSRCSSSSAPSPRS